MDNWADLWVEAKHVDILAVAERLGAKLKHVGPDWIGPCPLGCAKHDGFIITPSKGIFLCRPSKATGDVVDMAIHVQGVSKADALAFVLGRDLPGSPYRDHGIPSPRIAPKPIAPSPDDDFKRQHGLRLARAYAREIVPLIDTPGDTYLREIRRIDVDAIRDILERVDAIGWHPAVHFYEPGHPPDHAKLGCIIGIMSDPVTALPTGAISRTYLHDGKKVGKAKTLGSPAGIVRLTPDEDVLQGLYLAEGLETALDAMARSWRPLWSTGSANLMASFPVLAGIETLTIFADNDANGAGLIAAHEAAERWLAAGREVHVYQRETTGDLNDAYREVER
jgi:hypothetical protein